MIKNEPMRLIYQNKVRQFLNTVSIEGFIQRSVSLKSSKLLENQPPSVQITLKPSCRVPPFLSTVKPLKTTFLLSLILTASQTGYLPGMPLAILPPHFKHDSRTIFSFVLPLVLDLFSVASHSELFIVWTTQACSKAFQSSSSPPIVSLLRIASPGTEQWLRGNFDQWEEGEGSGYNTVNSQGIALQNYASKDRGGI